jgi:hypothetical protein
MLDLVRSKFQGCEEGNAGIQGEIKGLGEVMEGRREGI